MPTDLLLYSAVEMIVYQYYRNTSVLIETLFLRIQHHYLSRNKSIDYMFYNNIHKALLLNEL